MLPEQCTCVFKKAVEDVRNRAQYLDAIKCLKLWDQIIKCNCCIIFLQVWPESANNKPTSTKGSIVSCLFILSQQYHNSNREEIKCSNLIKVCMPQVSSHLLSINDKE